MTKKTNNCKWCGMSTFSIHFPTLTDAKFCSDSCRDHWDYVNKTERIQKKLGLKEENKSLKRENDILKKKLKKASRLIAELRGEKADKCFDDKVVEHFKS